MCTANGYHVPELPGLVQRPNAHSSQPNRSPEVHLNYDGRFAAPRGRGLVCRRRVPPVGHNPPENVPGPPCTPHWFMAYKQVIAMWTSELQPLFSIRAPHPL